MLAGISKSNSKFSRYTEWLEAFGIDYIVLDWEKNNYDDLRKCNALILTGGVDIFPEFYHEWEEGINREKYIPERDGFEFKLFDIAIENNYPILGICRGMQLINCRLNGNLISDIETVRGVNHRKISDTEDRLHGIKISKGSLLFEIVGVESGIVNSSHHQAVDRLGEGLVAAAKSDDGIIEAIEWRDKSNKNFLLGIQWHPERFEDIHNIFSEKIIKRLTYETRNYD